MAASPSPLISASRAAGAAITSANEPKRRDQLLGERLDVALRDGAEQQQFEQFVVGDGVRAGIAEALAQPFAMAVIVRRGLGEACSRSLAS